MYDFICFYCSKKREWRFEKWIIQSIMNLFVFFEEKGKSSTDWDIWFFIYIYLLFKSDSQETQLIENHNSFWKDKAGSHFTLFFEGRFIYEFEKKLYPFENSIRFALSRKQFWTLIYFTKTFWGFFFIIKFFSFSFFGKGRVSDLLTFYF